MCVGWCEKKVVSKQRTKRCAKRFGDWPSFGGKTTPCATWSKRRWQQRQARRRWRAAMQYCAPTHILSRSRRASRVPRKRRRTSTRMRRHRQQRRQRQQRQQRQQTIANQIFLTLMSFHVLECSIYCKRKLLSNDASTKQTILRNVVRKTLFKKIIITTTTTLYMYIFRLCIAWRVTWRDCWRWTFVERVGARRDTTDARSRCVRLISTSKMTIKNNHKRIVFFSWGHT